MKGVPEMKEKRLLFLGIVTEGADTTITASASLQTQGRGPLAFEVDWGDGSSVDRGKAGPGVPFTLGHSYPDGHAYTLDLRIGDMIAEDESSIRLRACVRSGIPQPA